MSAPRVTHVADGSPATAVGVRVGDELVSLNGCVPRDVIEYQELADASVVELVVRRHGTLEDELVYTVEKAEGEPLGVAVSSAVFDRVRTCDNHCAFCFIYQLPKGMRKSLYLKDDDYRLSFLYGNFTTLTRFTELDAERVLTERLGPLFVSIHATDPAVRAGLLRNPKGATSLRWLRVLLEGGIEVHGQVVVCPGVNDGAVLEDTLAGVLDEYSALATVGVVPLGVSDHSNEAEMRPHTRAEAEETCDIVTRWQDQFTAVLDRRMVYAGDEYYLLAGRPMPPASAYDGFPQLENGIGMTRAFETAFHGERAGTHGTHSGFFAWVDGAPAAGYRAERVGARPSGTARDERPVTVVTGAYGARVLGPLVDGHSRADVEILAVENDFFGGNIAVAGLLTGSDLGKALADRPTGRRHLVPDACLSEGRFLDGQTPDDLPVPIEVVPADGSSLRAALDGWVGGIPGDDAPSVPVSFRRTPVAAGAR
jgi:putative radical SAM enzyme (TIGR03279 family)